MYKLRYLMIISLVALLTSCSKDYCNRCSGVRMTFSYMADGSTNVLNKYIDSANLYIYNDQGDLINAIPLTKEQLNSTSGIKLDLSEGGVYTAVCWANLDGTNSEIVNNSKLTTAQLKTTQLDNIVETNGNKQALYFGSKKLTYSNSQSAELAENMELKSAHIKLNLKLKGLDNKNIPQIKIHNVSSTYDFTGRDANEKLTYTPLFIYNNVEKYYETKVNIHRFSIDNNIEFEIMVSSQGTLTKVKVNDLINKYYPNLNLVSKQEINLNFLIEFSGVDVVVTIPNWEDDDNSVGVI